MQKSFGVPGRFDLENQAMAELVTRLRAMRRKWMLPFLVVMVAAGTLGLIAHVTGYWSIFGTLGGKYLVNAGTILIAFGLPALPFFLTIGPVYRRLRQRVRDPWMLEYQGKGLSEDWLLETMERYP